MASKLVFAASTTATAVVAFTIGLLANSGPHEGPAAAAPTTRPSVTAPDTTPSQLPDVADDVTPTPTTTVVAPVVAAPSRSLPQHAKPTASPEKPAQKRSAPMHAKPEPTPTPTATKPKAGDLGPLKDAEGDGKLLDDVVGVLLPDMSMPFAASAGTAVMLLSPEPTEEPEPVPAYEGIFMAPPTADPTPTVVP